MLIAAKLPIVELFECIPDFRVNPRVSAQQKTAGPILGNCGWLLPSCAKERATSWLDHRSVTGAKAKVATLAL
jgi:hypothetical protein